MYIYETHMHTYEASACGVTEGKSYPQYYKDMGYSGIIVTDHFFNGNCRISKDLPWEEMVNQFCKGYENAKAEGDKIGFDVFFGWESNYNAEEFLIYGLDKQWLLDHPDMLSWSQAKQYEMVHAAGGAVVQAHPFRERYYVTQIVLDPENCDAIEGYNSSNPLWQNHNAERYGKNYDLFMTAGSDLHEIGKLQREEFYGMAFDTPLTGSDDYARRILNKEGAMTVPMELRDKEGGEPKAELPVVVH